MEITEFSDKKKSTYDLEERTALFSERLIGLCKKAPKTVVTTPIISQLIRAGTSIGANYCEANGASSKKDFKIRSLYVKKKQKKRSIGYG